VSHKVGTGLALWRKHRFIDSRDDEFYQNLPFFAPRHSVRRKGVSPESLSAWLALFGRQSFDCKLFGLSL
jgi:hypothetical protein